VLAQNIARPGATRFAVEIMRPRRFQSGQAFNDFELIGWHQQRL